MLRHREAFLAQGRNAGYGERERGEAAGVGASPSGSVGRMGLPRPTLTLLLLAGAELGAVGRGRAASCYGLLSGRAWGRQRAVKSARG